MPVTGNCFYDLLLTDHQDTRQSLADIRAALAQSDWPEARRLSHDLQDALSRHYLMEEHALFPVLTQYKTMVLMATEHDTLLSLESVFQKALQAQVDVMTPFEAWAEQLEGHIKEEEAGIFPMAEQLLEPEEKALVARKLAEVQQGLIRNPDDPQWGFQRPNPQWQIQIDPLWTSSNRPIRYDKLFEQDHAGLYHLALQAGKSLKTHWTAEAQYLVVITGQITLQTENQVQTLQAGMRAHLDPHLPVSLEATTDSHLLLMKVWPKPHFIRI